MEERFTKDELKALFIEAKQNESPACPANIADFLPQYLSESEREQLRVELEEWVASEDELVRSIGSSIDPKQLWKERIAPALYKNRPKRSLDAEILKTMRTRRLRLVEIFAICVIVGIIALILLPPRMVTRQVARSNRPPAATQKSPKPGTLFHHAVPLKSVTPRSPSNMYGRRNPFSPFSRYAQPLPRLSPVNAAPYEDMFFEEHGTNPFIDTEDDHLSTFAMDVDTASYSIARRYIRDGHLPPQGAVRVEEFINSFDYGYTPPEEGAFAIHIEGAPSEFGEGKRLWLLRIGIKGRIVPAEERKDATLTFVIDVSGSMDLENRLGLVKRALRLLVDQLRPTDEVGIVVYGSRAHVVLPHTGISECGEIVAAINRLAPGGSTNAEEGLRMGYDLAMQNMKAGNINRVILCSDGVANVGMTGPKQILNEIRSHVEEGITLSTVGFGMGNYNDVLMEQLADNGNGNYAYVDTINEAKRVFVEDLTGMLQTIAKDAKAQVDFNPEVVSRFRLLGYENRRLEHEQFRDDTTDAGEVGAGHSVTALYEIKLHEGASGRIATVYIRYENPDSHDIVEVSENISSSQLRTSFDDASTEFRLAAAIAEFAEILRGSYWAKDGSIENAYQVVKDILPQRDSDEIVELMSLMKSAISYQAQSDSPY